MKVQGADTPTLRVTAQEESSFTVQVIAPEAVLLTGLQIRYLDRENKPQVRKVDEDFDLSLVDGVVEPRTCLVYQFSPSPTPLACDDTRLIRINISSSDVFWYDLVENRPRELAILTVQDQFSPCPASVLMADGCLIPFISDTETVAVSLPEIDPAGECRLATAANRQVNVRPQPSTNNEPINRIQPLNTYRVLEWARDEVRNLWYRIVVNETTSEQGWVKAEVTRTGGRCEQIVEVSGDGGNVPVTPAPLASFPEGSGCLLATGGSYRVRARENPTSTSRVIGSLDPSQFYVVTGLQVTAVGELWYLTPLGWVVDYVVRLSPACAEIEPT